MSKKKGKVSNNDYGSWVLEGLNQQRLNFPDLCDLMVKVQDAEFPVHRGVLCQVSEYFSAMFSGGFQEKDAKEIDLSSLFASPHDFRRVLDFMYTGTMDISEDNIQSLLHGTSVLLLQKGKRECVTYLYKQLNLDNCFQILQLSEKYDIAELNQIILEMIISRCHDRLILSEQMKTVPHEALEFMKAYKAFEYATLTDVCKFIMQRIRYMWSTMVPEPRNQIATQADYLMIREEICKVFLLFTGSNDNKHLLATTMLEKLRGCEDFETFAKEFSFDMTSGENSTEEKEKPSESEVEIKANENKEVKMSAKDEVNEGGIEKDRTDDESGVNLAGPDNKTKVSDSSNHSYDQEQLDIETDDHEDHVAVDLKTSHADNCCDDIEEVAIHLEVHGEEEVMTTSSNQETLSQEEVLTDGGNHGNQETTSIEEVNGSEEEEKSTETKNYIEKAADEYIKLEMAKVAFTYHCWDQEALVVHCADEIRGNRMVLRLYAYLTRSGKWIELAKMVGSKSFVRKKLEFGLVGVLVTENNKLTTVWRTECEVHLVTRGSGIKQCADFTDSHTCADLCEDYHYFFCMDNDLYGMTIIEKYNRNNGNLQSQHFVFFKYDMAADIWNKVYKFKIRELEAPSSSQTGRPQSILVSLQESKLYLAMSLSAYVGVSDCPNAGEESRKRQFQVYGIKKNKDATFMASVAPKLEVENTQNLPLVYQLMTSGEGVYFVPTHSKLIVTTANVYSYDKERKTWDTYTLEEKTADPNNDYGSLMDNISSPLKDCGHSKEVRIEIDVAKWKDKRSENKDSSKPFAAESSRENVSAAEKGTDQKKTSVLTMSPGESLPIARRKKAPKNIASWTSCLSLKVHKGLKPYLNSIKERSLLIPSQDHGLIYQTRTKGPYVTELWSFNIQTGEWKYLTPAPAQQCLYILPTRMPNIAHKMRLAKFNAGWSEKPSLFIHYKLLQPKDDPENDAEVVWVKGAEIRDHIYDETEQSHQEDNFFSFLEDRREEFMHYLENALADPEMLI